MEHDILILDVTRMRQDRACIVGMTPDKTIVRPSFKHGHMLIEDLYLPDSQIIRPGAVLTMDVTPKLDAQPPHTEDYAWHSVDQTRWLRMAQPHKWRAIIETSAVEDLQEAFGAPLHSKRKIEPGKGTRSFASITVDHLIKLHAGPNMYEETGENVYRLDFADKMGNAYFRLPIVDLGFIACADHALREGHTDYDNFDAYFRRLLRRSEIYLHIGLARAFQTSTKTDAWCWMQVIGIHTFPDYLAGRCFADFRPR